MIFRKFAGCLFLIWLPIVVLEPERRPEVNGRLANGPSGRPAAVAVAAAADEDDDGGSENGRDERPGPKEAAAAAAVSSSSKFDSNWTERKISNPIESGAKGNRGTNPFGPGRNGLTNGGKCAQNIACGFLQQLSALLVYKNARRRRRRNSATVPVTYYYYNNDDDDEDDGDGRRRGRKFERRRRRKRMTTARKLLAEVVKSKNGGEKGSRAENELSGAHVPVPENTTAHFEDYEDGLSDGKEGNLTEMGSYLGAPCEATCSDKLLHVFCDPAKRVCECEDKYPVQIGIGTGCEKPKQLGDQCFYAQTCSFFDPNADCTQINHNAICQCKPGYHTVALRKGVKRMFCSEDIVVVSADFLTLLGVATGIAVLTGLLCFVLRLFSGARYPAARHYGNANIAPPLLYSSDNQWINGIPLTVQGRPSSRSSCQRSTTSLAQYPRNKGVMVPASRAGAARAAAILLIPCHLQETRHPDAEVVPNDSSDEVEVEVDGNDIERSSSRMGSRRHSLTSVHSTTSSQKSLSYSARRFEQENQQREQRAAMRAAREEAARLAALPTPSPLSNDDLLLIPSSVNTEEDLLCSISTESPSQSEPPALLVNKGNTKPKTSSTVSK